MSPAAATAEHQPVERLVYTPQEAANALGVSYFYVLGAIKSGALKAKKIGKGYRVRISDLDTWFDSLEDA